VRDWRLVLRLLAAGLVPLVVSGWFYARNVRITGNLAGAHLHFLKHRIARPFHEVITDLNVWSSWHGIYGYGVDNSSATPLNSHLDPLYVPFFAGVLVALPLVVTLILGLRLIWRRRQPLADIPVAVILVAIPVVVVLMQTQYVADRGGASWRYLMPLVPAICLAVATTVSEWPRLRPWLLCGWVALAVIPFAVSVGRTLTTPNIYGHGPQVPGAACAALGVGFAALAVALMTQLMATRSRDTADVEPHSLTA